MRADLLRRWEVVGTIAFGLFVAAFSAVVVIRSAYQQSRKTDFGVYARAAWAVRAGEDLYSVTDDNGWHYCYPPAFAILLAPLADPDSGADRGGYLPYGVSTALWIAFTVLCLAYTVHALAAAVLPDEPRFSRRWWYARTGPVYIALGGIGITLSRGQVNLFVVALIAGMFAAVVRGRRSLAGVLLASAAAVKVIPAVFVLFPLARRDARTIAAAAVAGVVLLFALPAALWGPGGAVDVNLKVWNSVVAPGAGAGGDGARAKELTDATATDSQSVLAAVHAWRHPDPDRRPTEADGTTKAIHWAVAGSFLLGTAAFAVRAPRNPADQLLVVGQLSALLILMTPVSHMHYYGFALPLVCAVWLKGIGDDARRIYPEARALVPLVLWGVLTAVPLFPGSACEFLRQRGLGGLATAGLWFSAGRMLRHAAAVGATIPFPVPAKRAA